MGFSSNTSTVIGTLILVISNLKRITESTETINLLNLRKIGCKNIV